MNLFFEEDGSFKAGTVLSQAGNAYQVELPTGRRTKIKASHAFFTFESPAAAEAIARAGALVPELDPGFLWEVAPEEEFSYESLAKAYWSEDVGIVEKIAMIFALHNNPVYFYRKQRGSYRKAPADILEKALEAVARKERQEAQRRDWVKRMLAGELPAELKDQVMTILVRPDKNSIEWKAVADAAAESRMSMLNLMLSLGGVASPWRWHVESFYMQNFPKGRGFSAELPAPETTGWDALPLADVAAFSIDDSDTTEIDDATSVTHLENGKTRVGIHIAAPAYGIHMDDALDRVASTRMSTVYAPGLKTTMLPEAWIQAFSLDEGHVVPCVSLYVTVDDATMLIEKSETRLERLSVKRNLRYDRLDSLVTEEAITTGTLDVEFAEEIGYLWRFAKRLLKTREEVRGRPEVQGKVDWFFALEGEGEDATIHVRGRRRGEPLDLLVAEMMILANSTWGSWLEEHHMKGIYRSQRMGRVRMSTSPGPHDGLGVERYAWSTSPLRRYVDMVNQRQIIATISGLDSPYAVDNYTKLYGVVSDFDERYAIYNDFQNRMDRYWSLRWIMQEGLKEIEAIVVKGDLLRIDGLPFIQRLPGLPEDLPRGRKVLLQIHKCDLVELVMDASLIRVLDESVETSDEPDENTPAETDVPSTDEGAASQPAQQSEQSVENTANNSSVGTPS